MLLSSIPVLFEYNNYSWSYIFIILHFDFITFINVAYIKCNKLYIHKAGHASIPMPLFNRSQCFNTWNKFSTGQNHRDYNSDLLHTKPNS